MDNGAIGFFLFFVILIIIWIFAMGGCVRERNSLRVYEGMTNHECLVKNSNCKNRCNKEHNNVYNISNQQCLSKCNNTWKCKPNEIPGIIVVDVGDGTSYFTDDDDGIDAPSNFIKSAGIV